MSIRICAIILLLLPSIVSAHSVTANFEFNIDGKNDIIHVNGTTYTGDDIVDQTFINPNKKYISSESGSVVSFIFSGLEFISMRLEKTVSVNYLFQLSQDVDDNRFIIGFSQGPWINVDSRVSHDIPSRTLGDYTIDSIDEFLFMLRLDYTTVDLIDSLRISGFNKLMMQNIGIDDYGKNKISIEVIE